jgi:hypothetical protein
MVVLKAGLPASRTANHSQTNEIFIRELLVLPGPGYSWFFTNLFSSQYTFFAWRIFAV